MIADGPGAVRHLPYPLDAVRVARVFAGSTATWCWLDGEHAAPGEPRTSYLGVAAEVRVAERGAEREFLAGLRASLRPSRVEAVPEPGAVTGFTGGWVVALGYEFGVALLGLDPAPDGAEASGAAIDDEPSPAFALRIDTVLAVDHVTGSAELRGACDADLDAWLREYGEALARASGHRPAPGHRPAREPLRGHGLPANGGPAWRTSPEEYEAEVEACRAAIRDGEAYVLCLTDTARVRGEFDPLAVYSRLRERSGAIRGGLLVTGERALLSASPERFLSIARDPGGVTRTVATHPIKGTRPRGSTPEEDAAHAADLANDPKERAENLMIVDLMRNDLSRVCVPGTVAVDGFLRVETHPHVHQLVSTVRGELSAGCDVFDAIAACFPGGSMTGAPKHRAVELLAALERAPRGLYSGCFGWIDRGGDAEFAMTIRGIELRGSLALVGAGGGITVDSEPARERAEKDLKAAAMLRALRATRYP